MINNLSFRSEFTGNVSLTSFDFNPHKENNSASNLQFYRSNKDGDRKVKLTVTGAATCRPRDPPTSSTSSSTQNNGK